MSITHEGVSVRGDEPGSVPQQRDRQINHREWTALVNEYLPQMWAGLSDMSASLELRHEACLLAWLRLGQCDEIEAGEQTGSWLLATARIELGRALARNE